MGQRLLQDRTQEGHPRIGWTLPPTQRTGEPGLPGIHCDIIEDEEPLVRKRAPGRLGSSRAIWSLAIVSINIMWLHIRLPRLLEMGEPLKQCCASQTRHGKQKLRMLLDLMVGTHQPLRLEDEKQIDISRSRPETNAERKRVPQLFDLSDYSR